MKTLFLFFLIGSFSLFGQSEIPFSWKLDNKDDQIVVHNLNIDSFAVQKALSNDSKGKYAVAINEKLIIDKHNFYLSHLSAKGDKVYQYRIVSADMKGFMFTLKFSDIGHSKIWFYNKDRSKHFGPF